MTTTEHLDRIAATVVNHCGIRPSDEDAIIESLTALRKTFEEFRDWSKVAHGFAWAHERTCPRHDADLPCDCGLDAFLSRPRPIAEGFKQEVTALRSTIAEMGEQLASLREREFAKQEACVDLSREVKVLTAERDKAIRDLGEAEQKIAALTQAQAGSPLSVTAEASEAANRESEPHSVDGRRAPDLRYEPEGRIGRRATQMIPKPIRRSQLKRRRAGPPRRSSRSLNPAYLDFLRTLPCFACYAEVYGRLFKCPADILAAAVTIYGRQKSPSEPAHIGLSTSRRGVSQKYPDDESGPLCTEHHTGQEGIHRLGPEKFFEQLGTDRDSVIRTFQKLFREHNG